MDYTYSYMIGVSVLSIIWLILYWWRSDIRHEMAILSGFFGVSGVIGQFFLRHDWWQPLTLTGTRVGLEDFLYGAAFGGVAAIGYEVLFKRRIRQRKKTGRVRAYERYMAVAIFAVSALLFVGLFMVGIATFWASSLALLLPAFFIVYRRPDLIADAIGSGVIAVIAQWLCFLTVELITPGWVQHFWLYDNLSGGDHIIRTARRHNLGLLRWHVYRTVL